jgi:ribosomal protein L21E
MTTMATTAACSATHASQSTPHEEDIDTLALRVKNLRIALSEAESRLALKKQEVMANKDEPPTKAKAEGRANAGFVPGDRVVITWDRYWRWNTSTARMPKTKYKGAIGTVLHTTECFVWVTLDDTNDVVKKKKHNVKAFR